MSFRNDRDALFARLEATLRENQELRERNAELERTAGSDRSGPPAHVERAHPAWRALHRALEPRASVPESESEPQVDVSERDGAIAFGVTAAAIVVLSVLVALFG